MFTYGKELKLGVFTVNYLKNRVCIKILHVTTHKTNKIKAHLARPKLSTLSEKF